MKISELVAELEVLWAEHGDVGVGVVMGKINPTFFESVGLVIL